MSCYSESIGQFLPGLEERLLQRYRTWCCLNHVSGDSFTLAHFFSLFSLKTLLPTFRIRSGLGFLSSYMLLLFFSMLCTLLPPHQTTFSRSASMNLCFRVADNSASTSEENPTSFQASVHFWTVNTAYYSSKFCLFFFFSL